MRYGPRERCGASLKVGVATALPIHMRKGIVEISEVLTRAECRQKGHASALFDMITLEADNSGKMLFLKVEDGKNREWLIEFYKRHDFAILQANPTLMIRPHRRIRAQQCHMSAS